MTAKKNPINEKPKNRKKREQRSTAEEEELTAEEHQLIEEEKRRAGVDYIAVRDRILSDEQFMKTKGALRDKWRRLTKDREFVLATCRLKFGLTNLLLEDPKLVEGFFSRTFDPEFEGLDIVRKRISRIQNKEVRKVLEAYIRYFIRFGVVMRREKAPPYFREILQNARLNTKFHVKVVRGNLEPLYQGWEDSSLYDLASDETLNAPPQMQQMVERGDANFVVIDDEAQSSLFKQVCDLAYSPDKLTFCLLNSGVPFLFCLVGDNVSVETSWHEAKKIVTEFQKLSHKRTRAGRPTNLLKMRRIVDLMLRKNSLKDLALLLASTNTVEGYLSSASMLSQLKKKLKIQ